MASISSAFHKAGDDLRIAGYDPLISPSILQMEHPLSERSEDVIASGRKQASDILRRKDDRLIVVVGPCSIHDPEAAIDYCKRLIVVADELKDDLCIVMRVYFNGTDGNATIAVDAIRSASHPHHFLGVTKSGLAAITVTRGNPLCHIILRGGNSGPNYEAEWVSKISEQIKKAKVIDNIMVDCSHGNSRKDHRNQPKVCSDVAQQVAAGNQAIIGVMIESNIAEGRQDIPSEESGGLAALQYGQSITDACVSWDQTVPMLQELAQAVRARRSAAPAASN
ncbi:3-deoxy-7-phosphoheptulonate synthase [Coemansia sp. Benny D115]|nr:3-deoxy-7-phosphoheptulonate synthase [Coemansia sp. Benny D115]